MKPRKSLSIYVLLVGVMALLIVGGVFAFQIFDEATKNQLPAAQKEAVKSLDGSINEKVIENLSKRKLFSREDLISVPTPTVSIKLEPSPISSPAAEASPSATKIEQK